VSAGGSTIAWLLTSACLSACAAPSMPKPAEPVSAAPEPSPAAPPLPVAASPDVELPELHTALIAGARLVYDGEPHLMAWPALKQSVIALAPHAQRTMQADRSVPMEDVLRVIFALQREDVRVQSKDATGVLRAVELRARQVATKSGCHAAVFVRVDGSLRVASPGGGAVLSGDDATENLVRALEHERAQCPIKYVAFGAESGAAPWGPVFDVLVAVDRAKSAGDARYVLGYVGDR
jgi:hypothetical protein